MEHQLLNLAGIRNAWQLGGYAGVCGRKVRRNLLIRSGKLSDAAPEDLLRLTGEYGLSTVIDLRSPEETADAPDPQMDGVRMIPIPVLEAGSANQRAIVDIYRSHPGEPGRVFLEMVRAGLPGEDLYTGFFDSEASMAAFRSFFDVLLRREHGAVLWHCAGGKDRTGLAAVMLLSILGVEKETVLQDFGRINRINRAGIDRICAEVGKYTHDAQEVQKAAALAGVSVAHMRSVFDRAERECGSMLGFVQQKTGLTNDEIDQLRRNYLE